MSCLEKRPSSGPLQLAQGAVIPQPSREEGVGYNSPGFKIVTLLPNGTCGEGREGEWGSITI